MLSSLPPVKRSKSVVHTVAVSQDGSRYLWACGWMGGDYSIRVHEAASNRLLMTLEGHSSRACGAEFLSDNSVVAASDDGSVYRWAPTGELAASTKSREGGTNAFALSNDR